MVTDTASNLFAQVIRGRLLEWNNSSGYERVKKLQKDLVEMRKRRWELRERLKTCDDYWKPPILDRLAAIRWEIASLLETTKYYRNGGKTLAEMVREEFYAR